MYIYVILSILFILFLFTLSIQSEVETFVSQKSEPDVNSLEKYCQATGRDVEAYKRSIVTHKYPKEAQWIETIVQKTPCKWASDVPLWSYAITDGSIEYGYAFTMGHTMYVPIRYLQNVEESVKKELVFHELRHIWQRQNYVTFIQTAIDPLVWKDWKFKIIQDPKKALKRMRQQCKKDFVINPDTFQVLSYYKDSEHPVYPLKTMEGLEYIMKDHTQKITWNDPHPCEWDAREAAQNIL